MKRITKEHIEMLTRRELSGRWRVSTETLKRKEKAGLLQALRIGRGIRYRLSDVLAFEAAAEVAR
jgi:DNA-binding transcriptional ArsR family regulator